jgi:hypothetical protein
MGAGGVESLNHHHVGLIAVLPPSARPRWHIHSHTPMGTLRRTWPQLTRRALALSFPANHTNGCSYIERDWRHPLELDIGSRPRWTRDEWDQKERRHDFSCGNASKH